MIVHKAFFNCMVGSFHRNTAWRGRVLLPGGSIYFSSNQIWPPVTEVQYNQSATW